MKKTTVKVLAMATILGLTAAGCQKENVYEPVESGQEVTKVCMMSYCVDGEWHESFVNGEEAYREFIARMVALAREGHKVNFREGGKSLQSVASKERVVYTTTSEADATKWCLQMAHDGYEVTLEYDVETGVYTCTAVKDSPIQQTPQGTRR